MAKSETSVGPGSTELSRISLSYDADAITMLPKGIGPTGMIPMGTGPTGIFPMGNARKMVEVKLKGTLKTTEPWNHSTAGLEETWKIMKSQHGWVGKDLIDHHGTIEGVGGIPRFWWVFMGPSRTQLHKYGDLEDR